MQLLIIEQDNQKIAVVSSETVIISHQQDALDLMVEAGAQGAQSVVVSKEHIDPDFFDLKTGLAGDVAPLEDVGPGRDDIITCPPDELPEGYADRKN